MMESGQKELISFEDYVHGCPWVMPSDAHLGERSLRPGDCWGSVAVGGHGFCGAPGCSVAGHQSLHSRPGFLLSEAPSAAHMMVEPEGMV